MGISASMFSQLLTVMYNDVTIVNNTEIRTPYTLTMTKQPKVYPPPEQHLLLRDMFSVSELQDPSEAEVTSSQCSAQLYPVLSRLHKLVHQQVEISSYIDPHTFL